LTLAPYRMHPTAPSRALTSVPTRRSSDLRYLGHPFASVMPYALDGAGRPVVLISSMAMHTQNLQADPRASLLVTQRGLDPPREEDRKSTRLNSSHVAISYAVFCLKKKTAI